MTDDVGVGMCVDVWSFCEFSVEKWCNDVVAASCFSMIICHYERVIRVNHVAMYMLSMTVLKNSLFEFSCLDKAVSSCWRRNFISSWKCLYEQLDPVET